MRFAAIICTLLVFSSVCFAHRRHETMGDHKEGKHHGRGNVRGVFIVILFAVVIHVIARTVLDSLFLGVSCFV